MPYCIKESDFDPSVHIKVSGPHTLEECQQNCDQVSGQGAKDCGCSSAS